MLTIGVDKSFSNSYFYEHICIDNIKTLYQSAGKCDDQWEYKAILEASMVSTPKFFSENSPM